nr:hypothetical protein [Actinomadura macra]
MATGVPDSIVENFTPVVAVAKGVNEPVFGDGTGWPLGSGCQAKPGIFQLLFDVLNGVAPGGEPVEGLPHERGTFWVEIYCANFPAVDTLTNIEVSDRGGTKRSAIAGLVRHLHFDVFAVSPGFHFVDKADDGLHGVTEVPLCKVFFGREERDTHARELGFGVELVP